MNNKISIAVKLWKVLFEAAMTSINPDKSGYDKLFKFFDAYVEFEELIFASDSFYRDHTLHCIWVYFLGEYLKRREEFHELFTDSDTSLHLLSAIPELFRQAELTEDQQKKHSEFTDIEVTANSLANKDEAIRCIAVLTHDLGYPLKKIEKINKSMKKVLPFFSVNTFADFSFEYENIQTEFVKHFIDFLSRETTITLGASDNKTYEILNSMLAFNQNGKAIGINYDAIRSLSPEDKAHVLNSMYYSHGFTAPVANRFGFWNDFEEYRHGIMSAFLLCKNIRAFQHIDYDTFLTLFDVRNLSPNLKLRVRCIGKLPANQFYTKEEWDYPLSDFYFIFLLSLHK